MSAALDYRGLLLFAAGHLTDAELVDAEMELHLLVADRHGVEGPRARMIAPEAMGAVLDLFLDGIAARRAACATCNDRGLWPAACPDCAREASDGHD